VLTQLLGIGPFTARVILAEVGDVSRFGLARLLASGAGLTPAVGGSGPHKPRPADPPVRVLLPGGAPTPAASSDSRAESVCG
jgi:transposase